MCECVCVSDLCVLCMRQMCEIICATASSFYKDLYSWPKRRDVGAEEEGEKGGGVRGVVSLSSV